MVYFDNAATGGFKVPAAISAAKSVIEFLSANPGRSGHRLSVTGAKIVTECREILAKEFGCDPSRVIFTKNCTEALNTAIFGGINGGKVVTTVLEHNSVLRPLYRLEKSGKIELKILSVNDFLTEITDKNDISAVVVTSASNVTGEVLPIDKIGDICQKKGIFFIVDGAQGGGHIPLSVKEQKISCLALAGHKGLGGIMGSGVLLINDDINIAPLTYGGTGTETTLKNMPEVYPERLEAGTLNLPAIASLLEGIRYSSGNVRKIGNLLTVRTERLINGLKELSGITVCSLPNPVGIVSFKVAGKDSEEVADILNREYDIAVRGGLHCAPLAHAFLGTEKEGLVRASLDIRNSISEIDYFIRSVKLIAG